jgi:hypothetical protein
MAVKKEYLGKFVAICGTPIAHELGSLGEIV